MLDRTRTRWRVAGVLFIVWTSLAWPTCAGATSSFNPQLISQTPTVTLNSSNHGTMRLALRTGGANGDADEAVVSVYPELHSRSALGPIVSGRGALGLPLATTGTFHLGCRSNGIASFSVSLGPQNHHAPDGCGHAHLDVRLGCRTEACDGVYPLAITTTNGVSSSTLWSLVAVTFGTPEFALGVAPIFTSNPVNPAEFTRAAKSLSALSSFSNTPLTVAVDYQGVSRAVLFSGVAAGKYRTELRAALASSRHGEINLVPPSIDFSQLVINHLGSSAAQQLHLATGLVDRFTGKTPTSIVELSGTVSASDVTAISRHRIRKLILPGRAFTVPPSSTLQSGTPFHVSGASRRITAVAADGDLEQLANDRAISPGLRAALTLGTLAMVHFQAPYAPATRTAVFNVSLERAGSTFCYDFLNGLSSDPLARARGVSGLFAAPLVGANGYPALRSLRAKPSVTYTHANVVGLGSLYSELVSLRQSVASPSPTLGLLVRLLSSETYQSSATRQRTINAVRTAFGSELADFQVGDTTITLTGSQASLPVTLTSTAPFALTGIVSVSASGVNFPNGANIPTIINTSTDSLRVPVTIRGSGNFTLEVRLLSANGKLVIASAAIQVQSAATSFVGYALSVIALMVIALWWWRTSRRTTRGRHAS